MKTFHKQLHTIPWLRFSFLHAYRYSLIKLKKKIKKLFHVKLTRING